MQKQRETVGWLQVVQSERGEDVVGGWCMEGRVLPGLGKDGAARLSRWEPLGSRDAHLEPPLVSLAAVRDSSALVRVRAHDCLDQSKG